MAADERGRTPADVEVAEMERLLSLALERGGGFADLYFEHHRTSSLLLEEGIIRTASAGLTCGLGVRVVAGDRTGYAYTDDLSWAAMARAAQTAAHIASDARTIDPQPVAPAPVERRYAPAAIGALGLNERIAIVQRAERAAHAYDPRVEKVVVTLADETKKVRIANSAGVLVEDTQPLFSIRVSVIASENGVRREGSAGGGGRQGPEFFEGRPPEHFAREAARMAATGNGRRQGYASIPIPRMTNAFMLAGQDDPADIIRSVPRGLYAKHFGGGQVDITSGKFVFSATEAYLIEDGRIGPPVVGATLIGNGPDILTKVTRIGHDLQLDEGVGVCSKAGQHIPVGVGLPTILVSEITVGGTRY